MRDEGPLTSRKYVPPGRNTKKASPYHIDHFYPDVVLEQFFLNLPNLVE